MNQGKIRKQTERKCSLQENEGRTKTRRKENREERGKKRMAEYYKEKK